MIFLVDFLGQLVLGLLVIPGVLQFLLQSIGDFFAPFAGGA
jgi:hypothetical protein